MSKPLELVDHATKRTKRMDRIDAMPPEIRACVHEYGLTIVDACLQVGVTKARHIHHLVWCIRDGSIDGRVPQFSMRPRAAQ